MASRCSLQGVFGTRCQWSGWKGGAATHTRRDRVSRERKAIVRFLGHLRTKQFGGTLLTQDDLAIELQRKATIPEQWLEVDGEYIFALIWHVPFDIPQSETLVDIDKCRDAAQELSKATTHIRQDVPRVCRLYSAAI